MNKRLPHAKRMIALIKKDVESGISFVPFIGSGMSAPSGILMGMEFTNFLAYAVRRVVDPKGNDGHWDIRKGGWPRYPRDSEVEDIKRWTFEQFKTLCADKGFEVETDDNNCEVKRVGFAGAGRDTPSAVVMAIDRPLIPEIIRSNDDSTWQSEKTTRLLQKHILDKNPEGDYIPADDASQTSRAFLLESAIRSLHDWRATLRFLARCRVKATATDQRVYLDNDVDESVVDSFNVHITRGRQVNLGQKMLAHLSKPLRIRTILTTNFDTLIEQAFDTLLTPLQVISVSTHGTLPSAESVRAQNSLVKLHGEIIETRADFSLDIAPSKKEKDTFARYVRGEFDHLDSTKAVPGNMLVIGFSGSDSRIIQMMKYLLDQNRSVKLYWICFSEGDEKRIRATFGSEYFNSKPPRIIFHITKRPDLFLYELYQQVNLCLPGGGFSYEFTHKVPPEAYPIDVPRKKEIREQLEEEGTIATSSGLQKLEEVIKKRQARRIVIEDVADFICDVVVSGKVPDDRQFKYPPKHPMARVEFEKDDSNQREKHGLYCRVESLVGGTGALRIAFEDLSEKRFHCLWMELQDYIDVSSLLEDILRILTLRTGHFQLEHFVLNPQKNFEITEGANKTNEDASKKYKEYLGRHLRRVFDIVDLSNRKWVVFLQGRDVPGSCAGWDNASWPKQSYEEGDHLTIEMLIDVLVENGIHVVYAPFSGARRQRDEEKIGEPAIEENFPKFIKHVGLEKKGSLLRKLKLHDQEKLAELHKRMLCSDFIDTKTAVDLAVEDSDWADKEKCDSLSTFDAIMNLIFEQWIHPGFFLQSEEAANLSRAEKFKLYLRRLNFLYTTTLFRQSRHTSAFFTEGVYKCPHRFNLSGLDNDLVRANHINRWVDELRALNVFYHKPGGYSWKYRDVRLGLQRYLEAMPMESYIIRIAELFGLQGVVAIKKAEKPFRFFKEIRSRAHYWIGDWYHKAFLSTGHYIPVLESLYHRFETIRHAPLAAFADEEYLDDNEEVIVSRLQYRLTIIRSSLHEMRKTLQISRPWLKFWLSSFLGHSMFRDIKPLEKQKNDTLKWLQKVFKSLSKQHPLQHFRQDIEADFDHLLTEIKCVQRSLRGEAFVQVSDLLVKPTALKETELEDMEIRLDAYRDKFTESTEKSIEVHLEKVGAEKILSRKNLEKITDPMDGRKTSEAGRIDENRRKWVRNVLTTDDSATMALRTVQLTAELEHLYLRRAKLESMAWGRDSWKARKRWLQTTIICATGLDSCKYLPPCFLSQELRLKMRLNRSYGLALAFLGRPYEANRHFNEAQAILSKSSRSFDELEVAVVRLRRAEASLCRVEHFNRVLDAMCSEDMKTFLRSYGKADGKFKGDSEAEVLRIMRKNVCPVRDVLRKDRVEDQTTFILELPEVNKRKRHCLLDPWIVSSFNAWTKRLLTNPDDSVESLLAELQRELDRSQASLLDDAWVMLESCGELLSGPKSLFTMVGAVS